MGNNVQLRDDRFQVKRVVHRSGANATAADERSHLADLLRLMNADDLGQCSLNGATTHSAPYKGATHGTLHGHAGTDTSSAVDVPVQLRRLNAGDMLFHEGARVESIYFVRAGTFKAFRTAEDGYEQVLGFSGRAEVLGFDAVCMNHYPNAAVALEDSSVYSLPVRDLYTLGQRLPTLDRVIHLAASRALARRGELADVMAAVAAEVRLARFLVQLSQRMAASGQSPYRFHLRMGRRDIASHLGVAHETVSRSFGVLSGWGLVSVHNREVEILALSALKSFARSTRGTLEEPQRPHAPNGHDAVSPAASTVVAQPQRQLVTRAASSSFAQAATP